MTSPAWPERLLGWYKRRARPLPWRRDRDPYRVWVSEIMLQQTTVATVLPYYGRFLRRFPDVRTLARASEAEVLKLWAGLGYYRRARNLHAAARLIEGELGGRFPRTLEGIRALPGVGRYTAAAVGSIAFGLRAAVLDGNVARVLSRLLALGGDPRANEARLWDEAGRLVAGLKPGRDPGDWNQALMELGATVCLPRSPLCGACPVSAGCRARARGLQERIPEAAAAKDPVDLRWDCLAAFKGGRVLLERREAGLLAGHWGLPVLDAARLARVAGPSPAGAVRHSITHHRLEVRVLAGRWRGALPRGWSWVDENELDGRLYSSLWRKALGLLSGAR